MEYIEYTITIDKSLESNLVDILSNNEIFIYEIISSDTIKSLKKEERDWDFVEEELLSINGDNISIKIYFNKDEQRDIDNLTLQIKEFSNISINYVNDRDWEDAWKKYYKTTLVGEKIVIKPTWEDYIVKHEEIVIEMDPGMAFGSGTHETTFMCLELLEKYMTENNTVLDIGCGSGILSIAAAKLKANNITAVDIDPVAIKVTKSNIENNKLKNKIKVFQGNLFSVVEGYYDLIISNIIAEVIVEMIDELKGYLNEKGIFICSGIIKDKHELVRSRLMEKNYEIIEEKTMGEWVAIVAQRQQDA